MNTYVQEGDVLAGKYLVERVLGQGGMGLVVAAWHLQLETRVAIKLLLPDMLSSADAVNRFVREARAAARITNEHVVRVTDVGTLESGAPYMVMEFLEGIDLAAALKMTGPMPVEQAVSLVLETCEALAEAHALGIVHRDLKPANLFWVQRPDGRRSVKVLDFGISKVLNSPLAGATTQTAAMLGTPYYMSPEQMTSSRTVDARTDIWALGVILYQLLLNDVPFDGDTLPAVCISVATAEPARIQSRRPDVPAALEAVILRCLEKDPNRRFTNVRDLALALVPFAPRRAPGLDERNGSAGVEWLTEAASSQVDRTLAAPLASSSPSTVSPFGRTSDPSASSRTSFAKAAALLAIAALAGLALLLFRLKAEPSAQPHAAASLDSSALAAHAPPSSPSPSVASTAASSTPSVSPVPDALANGASRPAGVMPESEQKHASGPGDAALVRAAAKSAKSKKAAAVTGAGSARPSPAVTSPPTPSKPANPSSAFDDRE